MSLSSYHPLLVGVFEAQRDEVDVIGFLLVNGSGFDGLSKELVDSIGGNQGLTLLPLASQFEPLGHFDL